MLAICTRKGEVARMMYEVIVLGNLNVSNLRMVSAVVPIGIRACFYNGGQEKRPGGEKSENQSQA